MLLSKCTKALESCIKDKSFCGLNPDPLPGIFYVRWERRDEKHTLLYIIFVLPILRGLRRFTRKNGKHCIVCTEAKFKVFNWGIQSTLAHCHTSTDTPTTSLHFLLQLQTADHKCVHTLKILVTFAVALVSQFLYSWQLFN